MKVYRFLGQASHSLQDGLDQLLMWTATLCEDGTRRLPEPLEVRPARPEEILRQAAQLLKKRNRQVQPAVHEIIAHPLDQAAQNLFQSRSLFRSSHLEEQDPPPIEVPDQPPEHRPDRQEAGGARRRIQELHPREYIATEAKVTVPCGSAHWP